MRKTEKSDEQLIAGEACIRSFRLRIRNFEPRWLVDQPTLMKPQCAQSLGAAANEVLDCSTYCTLFETLQGACSLEVDDCFAQAGYRFSLFPRGSPLCVEDVRYALFASCEVPPQDAASFANSVKELLFGFPVDSPVCDKVMAKLEAGHFTATKSIQLAHAAARILLHILFEADTIDPRRRRRNSRRPS